MDDDKELADFLNQAKNRHVDVDAELDAMIDDDPELRDLHKPKGKKKNFDDMDDINLSDLESDKEVDGDDELKELEEDQDDKLISAEVKEKPKEEPKQTLKEQPIESKPVASKSSVDLYPEKVESFYHNPPKMKSMGVLAEELKLMDDIIAYKQTKSIDYEIFENKKDLIGAEMSKIENQIACEIMDIEKYKQTIKVQLEWEDKFIEFANKDTSLTKEQLEIVLKRVHRRKEIINEELTQQVEQEEEQVEQQIEPEDPKDTQVETRMKEERIEKGESEAKINKEEPKAQVIVKPIDQKLLSSVKERLEHYKEAIKYFNKIGSAAQQQDAFEKAKELSKAVKMIEEGKEVEEFALPIDITPEYICGYSKQERLNKFSEIIKEFSKRKNELIENLNKIKEKFKSLDKRELVKMKDVIKKDVDQRTEKIESYNNLIAKLLESAKDPWVPAPLYAYVEEEERTEKINESIPPMAIDIYLGKTTYDKNNAYLWVNLPLNETKSLNEYIYFKQFPNYDQHLTWKLEKSEWNYLFRKTLEIQVFRTHWYWPFKGVLKGTIKIKLDPLKHTSTISDSFAFVLDSKRIDPKIEITIKTRTPITEKEWIVTSKPVFTVTKTFPPFRGEGEVMSHDIAGQVTQPSVTVTNPNVTITSNSKPKPSPEAKKQQPQPKKEPSLDKNSTEARINASEFTKDELEDPDTVDNLNSIKVLEFKIAKIQSSIDKIEGRTPASLRQKLVKTKCKKNILEQQLGELLSVEDYIQLMTKQANHDRNLAKYFEQEKMIEKGKLVSERIPILIQEINEAIDYAKSNKK